MTLVLSPRNNMGGGQSIIPLPKKSAYAPYPAQASLDGVSIGNSQGCKQCKLSIAQNVSSSAIRLYRQPGAIRTTECERLNDDVQKVQRQELSFSDFTAQLRKGTYYEMLNNGYCAQIRFTEDQLQAAKTLADLDFTKANRPRIRKMSPQGGFSDETKITIKPSIPFQMSFNDKSIPVSTIEIYHPCPVRVENVQYDAVMTLNSSSDPATEVIVMIPLKGALSSGPSGAFVSKFAPYISGLLQPNPASNQYEPIDVSTGNDWNLSRVLPVTAENGQSFVSSGYFLWNGSPELISKLKDTTEMTTPIPGLRNIYFSQKTDNYDWERPPTAKSPLYILLKEPITVNSFDLQTIRTLPPTPFDKAIHPPIPGPVLYKPGPPGTDVVGCPIVSPPRANVSAQQTEGFDNPECDPFQQIPPPWTSGINANTITAIVLGSISLIAVLVGVYFAMKTSLSSVGNIFQRVGAWLGKQFGSGRLPSPAALVPEVPSMMETTPEVREVLGRKKPSKPTPKATTSISRNARRTLRGYKSPNIGTKRVVVGEEIPNMLETTPEMRDVLRRKTPSKPTPKATTAIDRNARRTLRGYKSPNIGRKRIVLGEELGAEEQKAIEEAGKEAETAVTEQKIARAEPGAGVGLVTKKTPEQYERERAKRDEDRRERDLQEEEAKRARVAAATEAVKEKLKKVKEAEAKSKLEWTKRIQEAAKEAKAETKAEPEKKNWSEEAKKMWENAPKKQRKITVSPPPTPKAPTLPPHKRDQPFYPPGVSRVKSASVPAAQAATPPKARPKTSLPKAPLRQVPATDVRESAKNRLAAAMEKGPVAKPPSSDTRELAEAKTKLRLSNVDVASAQTHGFQKFNTALPKLGSKPKGGRGKRRKTTRV